MGNSLFLILKTKEKYCRFGSFLSTRSVLKNSPGQSAEKVLFLRIDYCDQRQFWECSHISGDSCMIWTHYASLEASEFFRSYHITKTIIRL